MRAGHGCVRADGRVSQRAVSVAVQRHRQTCVDTAPGRAAGTGRRAVRNARSAHVECAEAGSEFASFFAPCESYVARGPSCQLLSPLDVCDHWLQVSASLHLCL